VDTIWKIPRSLTRLFEAMCSTNRNEIVTELPRSASLANHFSIWPE
jgi:hypothetical protein